MIKNKNVIATTPARKFLLAVLLDGLSAVLPENIFRERFSVKGDVLRIDRRRYLIKGKRIFVVGAGKAAGAMAVALEKTLGTRRITAGVVVASHNIFIPKKIRLLIGTHPYPSRKNFVATREILDLKRKYKINKDDIVIGLISGGGSALMSYPAPGITFADKSRMYRIFREYGIPDYMTAMIKAKISLVKCGGLAVHFHPAQVISLVISDDNGESGHEFTASGPFTYRKVKASAAVYSLKRYGAWSATPKRVRSLLEKADAKEAVSLHNVYQKIIATNQDALENIRKAAKKKKINTHVAGGIRGETRYIAREIIERLFQKNEKGKALYIFGGETTVTLSGTHGKGGRAQEFALSILLSLINRHPRDSWTALSFATDGVDFVEDSAGGIVDSGMAEAVRKKSLFLAEHLDRHDSYSALKKLSAHIITGHTGTNVGDIFMFLKE